MLEIKLQSEHVYASVQLHTPENPYKLERERRGGGGRQFLCKGMPV